MIGTLAVAPLAAPVADVLFVRVRDGLQQPTRRQQRRRADGNEDDGENAYDAGEMGTSSQSSGGAGGSARNRDAMYAWE